MKMSARRPFIAGNWKCNGTVESVAKLVAGLNKVDRQRAFLFPTFPSHHTWRVALLATRIRRIDKYATPPSLTRLLARSLVHIPNKPALPACLCGLVQGAESFGEIGK